MRLKRVVAVIVSIAFVVGAQPSGSAAARSTRAQAGQQVSGAPAGLHISGRVLRDRQGVPDTTLRLRNLDTNVVVGQVVSDKQGTFSFQVQSPGRYLVEAIKADGSVLAVGSPLNLSTVSLTDDVTLSSKKELATYLLVAAASGVVAWALARSLVVPVSPER